MKQPTTKKQLLKKLFFSTLYLSTFTFGGGYVIVSLMKTKFVDELHWIDETEMLDLIAIAQSSPGCQRRHRGRIQNMRTSRSNSFHTRRSPSSIFHHFNYLGILYIVSGKHCCAGFVNRNARRSRCCDCISCVGYGVRNRPPKENQFHFHHVLRVHRQLLL